MSLCRRILRSAYWSGGIGAGFGLEQDLGWSRQERVTWVTWDETDVEALKYYKAVYNKFLFGNISWKCY